MKYLFKKVYQNFSFDSISFSIVNFKKKNDKEDKEFNRSLSGGKKLEKHSEIKTEIVKINEYITFNRSRHNTYQETKDFNCRPTVTYRGCARKFKEPKIIKGLESKSGLFLRVEHGNFGEDGFFIVQTDNYLVLGIADGVGGLSKCGIDPSVFSGSLVKHACRNSVKIIKEINQMGAFVCEEYNISAYDVLQAAYDDLLKYEGDEAIGSSTACFAAYNYQTKILQIANLGDSAIYVRKKSQFEFISETMQHSLNFPFQLTNPPLEIRKKYKKLNMPKDAIRYKIRLSEGDYFILGSDGVWDNTYIQMMRTKMDCENYKVEQSNNILEEKQKMVDRFADDFFCEVLECSQWPQPGYRLNNQKENARYLQKELLYGGKRDDISLIMVLV